MGGVLLFKFLDPVLVPLYSKEVIDQCLNQANGPVCVVPRPVPIAASPCQGRAWHTVVLSWNLLSSCQHTGLPEPRVSWPRFGR